MRPFPRRPVVPFADPLRSSARRRPRSPRPALAALSLALVATAPGGADAQNQPSFQGLGGLDPAAVESIATAVNADGSVVVGSSIGPNGQEAFRWTELAGLDGLGDLSGGEFFSFANAVSDDGQTVVGTGAISNDGSRAFRTTSPFSSLQSLPNFSCSLVCPDVAIGNGLSPDGSVVVGAGTDRPLFGDPYVEAARWVASSFSIQGLGHLSGGGSASAAWDATANGGVIVGDSDSSSGTRAFWWNGSLHALPSLVSGAAGSSAQAISADGSTIVGWANSAPSGPQNAVAVRWTGSGYGTIETLGSLPGASVAGSRAFDVTPDGAIVVGTANDAAAEDVAFLWDASGGMRSVKEELEQVYGLDLTGWTLTQATGVSHVNGAGEFAIVGAGINPDGENEAWIAWLSPVECGDGIDNDSDGLVDFPADPECRAPGDRSEVADCSDGLDDDGDGLVDWPADPECVDAADLSEGPDCSDGIDDDGDGLVDYPADPGCRSPAGLIENPACDDGLDQDGDGKIDYPADPECLAADDQSEVRDCNDGLDNDGDGLVDLLDPDCADANDDAEDPACSNRLDDDSDGRRDWPEAYPACSGPDDPVEAPVCSDGVDQDGDGQVDFPADADCAGPDGQREDAHALAVGDLVAVSPGGRRVFRIDPATGAQSLVSEGALLESPQGVAVRPGGALVVADTGGLVEVDGRFGTQRRLSGPLSAFSSLQVVFDPTGDPVVLELSGLTHVDWVLGGTGASTSWLPVPTPGSPAALFALVGDSLALEASGDYLTTGLGAGGDGVFRVDASTGSVTALTPGFSSDKWFDLAVETDGRIVAVGVNFPTTPGVFRIDPSTGLDTPISTGPEWIDPVAVAVGASGDLYVADAGTCDGAGVCTGSSVVRVDPASGARLAVWSGGFIDGPLDLAVVDALPACADGADDDGDGAADFPADAGCVAPADPSELPQCADGLDNDGDGAIDLADVGCRDGQPDAREDPVAACSDGLDNDQDGKVDWDGGPGGGAPDPQCADAPWKNKESKGRCGLGFELVAGVALAALARRRRRAA